MITMYEEIKNNTIEEMAIWLYSLLECPCSICPHDDENCNAYSKEDCHKVYVEMLNSEVKSKKQENNS